MYLFLCLLGFLVFSVPASAEMAEPLQPLSFNANNALAMSSLPLEDMAASATSTDDDPAIRSLQLREQRRNARERIFEALGVSRYLPNGNFAAFGHEARWSLSLQNEESVVLRLRMKW